MPPQSVICPASPAIAVGTAGEGSGLGDLLPHLRGVIVDKIECMPGAVLFSARYWPAEAACPACGIRSARGPSSYIRQVRDLPLSCQPVLIHLAMRRFLCQNAACTKVTFAGQADGLTARYQRWSVPLAGLLTQVALELAGRAGTRLARALGIAVHHGTLLRLVIDLPDRELSATPQVPDSVPRTIGAGVSQTAVLTEAPAIRAGHKLPPGSSREQRDAERVMLDLLNGDGYAEILECPRCPRLGTGHEGRCGQWIAQAQDQPRLGGHRGGDPGELEGIGQHLMALR